MPQTIQPVGFLFVKHNENPDLSIRKVGRNAGIIDTNTTNKVIHNHDFIKFINGVDLQTNIDTIRQNVVFDTNNTIGMRSISRQEIILKYNEALSKLKKIDNDKNKNVKKYSKFNE